MSEPSENRTNVTVDQMIEHMTADLHTSDGQYIQLGFTPPQTPNDSNWHEYSQNAAQTSANPFMPSFNIHSQHPESRMNYVPMEQCGNFPAPNTAYNSYIMQQSNLQQNSVYYQDVHSSLMNKSLPEIDQPEMVPMVDVRGNGGYFLYKNTHQFVQANQDVPMCRYLYPDNREYNMFQSQDIENLHQMQQNQLLHHNQQLNLTDPNAMYLQDKSLQRHQDNMLLHQAMQHHKSKTDSLQDRRNIQNVQCVPNSQPSQNGTQLIENLVGNWAPNMSGTYSPFGSTHQNSMSPNSSQFDKNCGSDLTHLSQNRNVPIDLDFSGVKNVNRNGIKKQRAVAEVKPMRPSYSDVLAKSVPSVISKIPKSEQKDTKNKSQGTKKGNKTDKSQKSTQNAILNRQVSGNDDAKDIRNDKNNCVSPQHKVKASAGDLSRKWSSLNNLQNDSTFSNNANIFDITDNDTDEKVVVGDKSTEKKTVIQKNKKSDETVILNNKTENAQSVKNISNNVTKRSIRINNNLGSDWNDTDGSSDFTKTNSKNSEKNTTKSAKKAKEPKSSSSLSYQSKTAAPTHGGVTDKPPAPNKRGQRARKKESQGNLGVFRRSIKQYIHRWSRIALSILLWFFHLLSDVANLSLQLLKDLSTSIWKSLALCVYSFCSTFSTFLLKVKIFSNMFKYIDEKYGHTRWSFWNRGKKEKQSRSNKHLSEEKGWLNSGLEANIIMPTTGEEAMKRLLACKGKDPYSILGVTPDCTDDDIKRYYKKQAFLVHPDKNSQPGAEEAFKILVHAFDIIGEPERRQSYDRKVAESHQVEQAFSELNDLLSQLHKKMEYAANTIRCTNCTKRHRRIHVDRPCYAARLCAQCKIHHAAREGDIWAESTCFGFLWHYYACMDGAVYDITEWAGCQRANLRHLRPNTHLVQYRIVLGRQTNAGNTSSGAASGGAYHRHRAHRSQDMPSDREPDLEEFLNSLYSQTTPNASSGSGNADSNRPESGRSKKRNKRKK